MDSFKDVCRIAGAFVGVIVGAGFASGQEILQFFASFGLVGLIGCVVSGALFALLSMAFSTMGQRLAAESHKEVVHAMLGRHLGLVFDVLITFFLFAITVVMLAGAGSLLNQWLGVPEVWGSVLATVFTILIVCLDIRSVIAFIGTVTPFLMFMTVVVAGYVLMSPHAGHEALAAAAQTQPRGAGQWLVAALLYVSYNLVAGMPFLVIMGGRAKSRSTAFWGGALGGLLLGLLILLIAVAMYLRMDTIGGMPMPMLSIATQILFAMDFTNILGSYAAVLGVGSAAMIRHEKKLIGWRWIALPAYWMMVSAAAWRAVFELRSNPFLWRKTPHEPARCANAADPPAKAGQAATASTVMASKK